VILEQRPFRPHGVVKEALAIVAPAAAARGLELRQNLTEDLASHGGGAMGHAYGRCC